MEGPQITVFVDKGNSAIPDGENELGSDDTKEINLGDFLINRITSTSSKDGKDKEKTNKGVSDDG